MEAFRSKALAMACAFAFILTTSQAQAQNSAPPASSQIEEIIVTAQRRSTNLQTTPISITALTSDALETRGITDVSMIGNVAPNVTTTSGAAGSGGSSNLQLYMRGVGQYDFLASTDPGVGLYVDGVYYARSMGSIFDLLDVQRVEVLRGPQGTLFGKNAVGGAIQVITAPPEHQFDAAIEGLYGSFNRTNLRGFVNLPVSDSITTRLSVSYKRADAYGTRLDYATGEGLGRDMGDQNNLTLRGVVDYQPTSAFDVLLSADYTRVREESPPVALAYADTSQGAVGLWNALVGGPAGTPWDGRYIRKNPFVTYATGGSPSDLDAGGVAATITWKGAGVGVKSITAYRKLKSVFGVDQDGSPLDFASTFNIDHEHQFSQELQLSGTGVGDRLQWLVGGFYFDERTGDNNQARLVSGLYPALQNLAGPVDGSPSSNPTAPGGFGNPLNLGVDLDLSLQTTYYTKSHAVFGQATFDITDRLSVSGGLRYTSETKRFDVTVLQLQSNNYILPPGSTVAESYGNSSPKVSVDYRLTKDLYTYVSYAEGFKAGGFDGRPTSAAEGLHSFRPEELASYELGMKATFLDRRVRLNMDGYHSVYRDIQLRTNTVSEGELVIATDNAGRAHIDGFEAELTVIPIENLELNGSVGLTDFKYVELGDVPGLTLDSQPIKTPKWQSYSSAQYTIPTKFGGLTLFGDWNYRTRVFQDAVNSPQLAQGAYSLFDAKLTFVPVGSHWSLSAFLNNIADKRAISDGFTVQALGFYDVSYIRPREWGVVARYKF